MIGHLALTVTRPSNRPLPDHGHRLVEGQQAQLQPVADGDDPVGVALHPRQQGIHDHVQELVSVLQGVGGQVDEVEVRKAHPQEAVGVEPPLAVRTLDLVGRVQGARTRGNRATTEVLHRPAGADHEGVVVIQRDEAGNSDLRGEP